MQVGGGGVQAKERVGRCAGVAEGMGYWLGERTEQGWLQCGEGAGAGRRETVPCPAYGDPFPPNSHGGAMKPVSLLCDVFLLQ